MEADAGSPVVRSASRPSIHTVFSAFSMALRLSTIVSVDFPSLELIPVPSAATASGKVNQDFFAFREEMAPLFVSPSKSMPTVPYWLKTEEPPTQSLELTWGFQVPSVGIKPSVWSVVMPASRWGSTVGQ